MKDKGLTKYSLYRWRYVIAYGFFFVALIASLVVAGLYLPGALSDRELATAVASGNVSFEAVMAGDVINLPYHALQWLSFTLFGVTTISIKLPSLILGGLAAIALVALLRQWFRQNVSILAAIIAITTSQFLVLSQSGTIDVLAIFWPVVLLLFATLAARQITPKLLWRFLLFVAIGLSLYTPLSIYILIAIGLAILFHPHLRHLIKRTSPAQLTAGGIISLTVAAPLLWACIREPATALELLGIPTSFPPLLDNLVALGQQYIGIGEPTSGLFITPVFGIGTLLLIFYGLYHIIRSKSAVHGYIILTWLICLLPVLVLNPSYTAMLFVPMVLLLTTGLSQLLASWYGLFPMNPYARAAGLLPVVILVSSLVVFGFNRYAYSYHYTPAIVQQFSHDLSLLPSDTTTLVVSADEAPFYETVADFRDGTLTVTETAPEAGAFTASKQARVDGVVPDRIIVGQTRDGADRFYLYNSARE